MGLINMLRKSVALAIAPELTPVPMGLKLVTNILTHGYAAAAAFKVGRDSKPEPKHIFVGLDGKETVVGLSELKQMAGEAFLAREKKAQEQRQAQHDREVAQAVNKAMQGHLQVFTELQHQFEELKRHQVAKPNGVGVEVRSPRY